MTLHVAQSLYFLLLGEEIQLTQNLCNCGRHCCSELVGCPRRDIVNPCLICNQVLFHSNALWGP